MVSQVRCWIPAAGWSQNCGASTFQRGFHTQCRATDLGSDAEPELGRKLEIAWQAALTNQDNSKLLSQLLATDCKWDGDTDSATGVGKIEERLNSLGTFLLDPKFLVNRCIPVGQGSDEVWSLDWAFSATWPLPWRPRIRLYGDSRVVVKNGFVQSINDKWRTPSSLFSLINSQVSIFHIYP